MKLINGAFVVVAIATTLLLLAAAGAEAATSARGNSSNCTAPAPVSNLFNITGLDGWQLVSHEDYLSNSAAEHYHNLNCSWLIRWPAADSIVLIRIKKLELESGSHCEYDSLRLLYLDYSSKTDVNNSYCGTVVNRVLLATSDVRVSFKTDSSVSYRGFQLQWAFVNESMAVMIRNSSGSASQGSECSRIEGVEQLTLAGISAPGGRLVSHDEFGAMGYSTYENNLNCQWTLTSPTGYILLWIEELRLEYSSRSGRIDCSYDNLTLNFSNAVTGEFENLTFCRTMYDTMYLSNTSIAMKFMTDSSVGSKGFHIKWMYLNASQVSTGIQFWSVLANNSNTNCTKPEAMNLTLTDVGQYPGGRLVSHTEFLTNLNSTYHPNMNCSWTISPPNNSTIIYVEIVTLELETTRIASTVCRYDNLTFAFKNAVNNRWEQKVICSSLHSVAFTSSDSVTIRFVTDHSVSKRGFQLRWYLVPRSDAPSLPFFKNWNTVVCPPLLDRESAGGLLRVYNYAPNTHCAWTLNVDDGYRMTLRLIFRRLDPRDDNLNPIGFLDTLRCAQARDKLKLEFLDSDGDSKTAYFCGFAAPYSRRAIVAYPGRVQLTFTTDDAVEGRGFVLLFRREEFVKPTWNCSSLQAINDYQSKLSDSWPQGVRRRCKWTFRAKDESHLVKISLKKYKARASPVWSPIHTSYIPSRPLLSGRYCPVQLTVTANKSIDNADLGQLFDQVYSSSDSRHPEAVNSRFRALNRTVCLASLSSYWSMVYRPLMGMGQVELEISTSVTQPFSYELLIEQIPTVFPGSANLCTKPTVLGTQRTVIATDPQGRLVSVKQMRAESPDGDCRTVVRFGKPPLRRPSYHAFQLSRKPNKLKLSVNCSSSSGRLVVLIDGSINLVACNEAVLLNRTRRQLPVVLVSERTRGFTAKLEQIVWISDGSYNCPKYKPTKDGSWISNLPLFSTMYRSVARYVGRFGRVIYYCEFNLSPPAGRDLIVQVKLPLSIDSIEQVCSKLNSVELGQPQLIIVLSEPNTEDNYMSLCDQNEPGNLIIGDKIRVPSGGSLTVDVTTARLYPYLNVTGSSSSFSPMNGFEAVLVSHEVDSCTAFNSSLDWKKSSDGKQIQKTIAIVPNNTQTDCRIRLPAPMAVRIANENRVLMTKNGDDGCWNVKVMLNKFATTCGLNQLILTVSYWDSMAGSIAHKQIDVCGNWSFSFSMTVGTEPESGSGMSLYYSGVRSGFVAQFSVSACQKQPQTMPNEAVRSTSGSDNASSALTAVILLLILANVCVIAFAFRATILTKIRHAFGGGAEPQRMSFTPGGDGVALLDDSS